MHKSSKSKLALIAFAAGMTLSLAAGALPHPNPGESYIQTYYSDATYTEVVGERGYGDCLNPRWGVSTRYVRLVRVVCPVMD
ncbi:MULTISPECIES: DUF6289 family protein [Lysobacter]|uniref:DUF6289 family protein n=1 Tax=Lysobacter yananisis TaxID=1003114 RepID=A0ABY9P2V3_9GAMM|nr:MULTISPECIES: DUF6289 family protein [Lysobacter]QQQ02916.1 hypothetical protein JHW41_08130 [Lysobacter enzymogenes]WMT01312.1 DUF6289 family protein [Lysobacter yananisis]